MIRKLLLGLLALALAAIGLFLVIFRGGRLETAGKATDFRVPAEVRAARSGADAATAAKLAAPAPATPAARAEGPAKQILFGDLHVHTTFSADAFQRSLPMLQGEGAHPPADACDFARFCSGLDFWSITDHAEGLSPRLWQETKESIRQCNALAGDPKDPDAVAFLGWEWTQVGITPETHYGHKNVIFRDVEEDRVPKRPIAASGVSTTMVRNAAPIGQRLKFILSDLPNRQRYLDFGEFQREVRETDACPAGVDVHTLPPSCQESATTPRELFEKLSQWGFETLVIPHGTTWGLYTPVGVTLDKQLTAAQDDPDKQRLIEVFSGHGNSEEFRPFKEVAWDEKGEMVCPEPTSDYLPCCWQAGELVRERCGDAPKEECERRVLAARRNHLAAGSTGYMTVPGARPEEWKDCGQCKDCFLPSFQLRPGDSVQYGLAIGNFDQPGPPRRFRWGMIGSSDNHSARPGTGYKEYDRHQMTEVTGAPTEELHERLAGKAPPRTPESVSLDPIRSNLQFFQLVDFERQASFFMTGGLVAVHSPGRDRGSIWNALESREVYATSGDRILLWFDLLNGPAGRAPMGSEAKIGEKPRFRVRAAGSFKQKPGCPDFTRQALPADRLEYLCRGECYNPSDERRRITRIEVVRIRPQVTKGEPVAPLIQDPWKKIDCPADPSGCVVEFEDPDFVPGAREATYYVRAIQEPTDAVNGKMLRCDYDENGNCVKARPCFGDYRTAWDDDCLSPVEERAWSSPIFLVPGPAPAAPSLPSSPPAGERQPGLAPAAAPADATSPAPSEARAPVTVGSAG